MGRDQPPCGAGRLPPGGCRACLGGSASGRARLGGNRAGRSTRWASFHHRARFDPPDGSQPASFVGWSTLTVRKFCEKSTAFQGFRAIPTLSAALGHQSQVSEFSKVFVKKRVKIAYQV